MTQDALARAAQRLDKLFLELNVNDKIYTEALSLAHLPIISVEAFAEYLAQTPIEGGQWAFLASSTFDPQQLRGLAMPVPESATRSHATLFPYVEVHTRAIAWWLTYAWRVNELRATSLEQFRATRFIAAAACARSLVETSAQFWLDTRKLAQLWDVAKTTTSSAPDRNELPGRNELLRWLNVVQWGGKFNDRAAADAPVERPNIQTAIDKLARVTAGDLQTDYQWLCNAVHPSIGNTLAYAAPLIVHETSTHAVSAFSGRPLVFESAGQVAAESTIEDAISRSMVLSLEVLATAFDEALRVIDDIGLTTRAAELSPIEYWRALTAGRRNHRCPCRSGEKTKNCVHAWGTSSPFASASFI